MNYYAGCSRSNRIWGTFWGYAIENDCECTTRCCNQMPKFSFLLYNLFWNKQFSKTATFPYFAFERWRSQDMITGLWYSMAIGKAHIKRSPLRIWSNNFGKKAPSRTQVFFVFGEFRRSRQREFHWRALIRHTSDHCYSYIHRGSGKNNLGQTKGYHLRDSAKS